MILRLRQLTREDWNDISKLRFRDYKGEILEVKVFDVSIKTENYPVAVAFKTEDGLIEVESYTIDGFYFSGKIDGTMNILVEEPEEIDYEEIVKELFFKKAIIKLNDRVSHVTVIDLNDMNFLFSGTGWYKFDTIKDMEISFDLKTFYTFDEYLELRRKENE